MAGPYVLDDPQVGGSLLFDDPTTLSGAPVIETQPIDMTLYRNANQSDALNGEYPEGDAP